MEEKTRMVIMPNYMTEFSCIGSACEDTCCSGWAVTVDKDTYKKYKKMRGSLLKSKFEENVKRNRHNANDINYGKITMENGECSFLDEEKLCSIQVNHGSELLCNTCTVYPRTLHQVNGVVEKSATMSCPEAARLALLNPEPMEFDELLEPREVKGTVVGGIDTSYEKGAKKYFWELRIFTIQVLQNRAYTISERMVLLGLTLQKVQECINENRTDDILAVLDRYTVLIGDGSLKEMIATIPKNTKVQMEFAKALVDIRLQGTVTSQRYVECLGQMLNGLHYREGTLLTDVVEQYEKAFETYYKPFMQDREYILEHYVVNHVFKNLFPFGRKDVFADYVMLAVYFGLIKLHLIGMAGHHEGLTEENVVKLIQSLSKTVEHNTAYVNRIDTLLSEQRYNTMGYMSILVMN